MRPLVLLSLLMFAACDPVACEPVGNPPAPVADGGAVADMVEFDAFDGFGPRAFNRPRADLADSVLQRVCDPYVDGGDCTP